MQNQTNAETTIDVSSCESLRGKNVLLTGATGLLGGCIARTLWREGASLVVTGRNADLLERLTSTLPRAIDMDQRIHAIAADIGDHAAAVRIIDAARHLWSRLDVLINNAAVIGPIGPVWETDWDAWQQTIQVNLLAPAALCRLSVPWMRHSDGGSIINISGGGATTARPRFSAYATAKAGLVRFSETLAEEVLAYNISVNCVAPGPMNSAMLDAVVDAGPERAGKEYERALAQQRTGTASPQNPADLIAFLASSSGRRITGKLISAVWDPWRSFGAHLDDLQKGDIYTLRRITPSDRGKCWA